jgi:excisionase family DNA binding protein
MIQVQLDPNLTMKLESIDKKLDLLVKRANRETERLKMNPLLTVDETMVYLRVSKSTFYRLLRRGDLRSVNSKGRKRFRREDLDAFLMNNDSDLK